MIFIEGPAILYYGAAFCTDIGTGTGQTNPITQTPTCLGITESGVQISISNLTTPVNTDDMGGTEGFPAEIINMAATASIRGVLVDYNAGTSGVGNTANTLWKSVSKRLERGVNSDGVNPNIGASYFGDNYGFSLRVAGANVSYIFPRCSLLEAPREFNFSTGAKKTSFTFTAYPIFQFAIDATSGANYCQYAFLYRKIDSGAIFAGCHDAIGGYEHDENADNQYHYTRSAS